jgi:GNAT superfamily N-acetyltransferase
MIRYAKTPNDAFIGLDLFLKFYEFMDLKKIAELDRDVTLNILKRIIETDVGDLIISEDENGKPNGAVCVYIMNPVFAPQIKILLEMFWFVDPSARKQGVGTALLNEAEKWAVEHKCDAISFSNLGEVAPEQAKRVYESRGFSPCEQTFWKFLGSK